LEVTASGAETTCSRVNILCKKARSELYWQLQGAAKVPPPA